MKVFFARLTLAASMVAFGAAPVYAQRSPARSSAVTAPEPPAELEVLHVQGNIYAIFGAGGNVTVSVGKDGVFVVDSGTEANAERLLEAITKLQAQVQASGYQPVECCAETRGTLQLSMSPNQPPKPIRFIVNTHVHADHVGGNAVLAKAGRTFTGGNVAAAVSDAGEGAMVFAHENVLARLANPPENGPRVPSDGWPVNTFQGATMNFSHFFNGEGIQLFHPAVAHTDGDTYVYFRDSDVLVTGDLFITTTYPFIDVSRRGHISGIIDSVNAMLNIAVPEYRLEGGTLIVPGHGRVTDVADLAYYRDMLTIIRDRVQNMIDKGMTVTQVVAAGPTKDYDPRFGVTNGFWTTNQFVEAVYENLVAARGAASSPR